MSKLLTPVEFKVMKTLWKIKKGFVKDILESWTDEPKPAYNTVSTIVRILQDKKGFIGHKEYGRTHEYFPTVSKVEYQKMFLKNALQQVFSGSTTSLVSTLMDDDDISRDELDEIKRMIDEV